MTSSGTAGPSSPDAAADGQPATNRQPAANAHSEPPASNEAANAPAFDPFPFGAPDAGSPVAAAFPELFGSPPPGAAPNPSNGYGPPTGYGPNGGGPGSAGGVTGVPGSPSVAPTYPPPTSVPYYSGYQAGPGQAGPGQAGPGQPGVLPPPGYPAAAPYGYPPTASGPFGAAPGYPPGYGPAPANGKAVAGLVLGIVSLVLFFFTVLDIPLIVLGIVFSSIGLSAAKQGHGRRGMALAGLVCSIVAAVVVAVAVIHLYSRISTCDDRYDRDSSQYKSCLIGFD